MKNKNPRPFKLTAAGLLCGGIFCLVSSAEAVLFRLPLAVNPAGHYYYDHGGVTDWKCGSATYAGHEGTDFGAARNTVIYSGAVGTLAAKQDGWGDGSLSTDPSHANYVIVNHAGGMRTLYWHMVINSVTTKPIGSAIACGEQIGKVGTSGRSSGPHLHFEPQLNGVPDDPYSGTCGGPITWWVNQNNGNPVTTCQGAVKTARTVDNSNAGFSVVGTWATGTSAADKFGSNYRFHSTAAISEPATWTTTLNTSATWNVYAWWSAGANRSATAQYIVSHGGTTTVVTVNQQINGGKWVKLGSWPMSGTVNVKLSCWTTAGYVVVADAVRWD